jgi:hypothetical protein
MRTRTAVLPALLLASLLSVAAGVPEARAATVGGRSSTQALWYSDAREIDQLSLAEYVRFGITSLDKDNSMSVAGYGRLTGELYHGGGVDGRLYHLYLDKKALAGVADVRVGRQLLFVTSGSALVDGAKIRLGGKSPFSLTLGGGRDVLFSEDGEYTRGGDMAFAGQAAFTPDPTASINASWLVKYDESELSRSMVGLGADKRFGKYLALYGEARLDTISEVFNEILLGARTAAVKGLVAEVEFFRSVPTFDATSIYSVFAVERYQEIAARADYALTDHFSVEGEYRNESYGLGDTANVGEAGLRWRTGDRANVRASAIVRSGAGGHLTGYELSGETVVAKKYILAAGYQGDVYKRDLMTGYDSTNRFWLGCEAKVREDVSVSARVEDSFNDNWDGDWRARLALNLDF